MNQNTALSEYHNKRAKAYRKDLFVLEEDLRDYEAHMASLRAQGKRVDAFREGRKRRYLMAKIDSVRYLIDAENDLAEFMEKIDSVRQPGNADNNPIESILDEIMEKGEIDA